MLAHMEVRRDYKDHGVQGLIGRVGEVSVLQS